MQAKASWIVLSCFVGITLAAVSGCGSKDKDSDEASAIPVSTATAKPKETTKAETTTPPASTPPPATSASATPSASAAASASAAPGTSAAPVASGAKPGLPGGTPAVPPDAAKKAQCAAACLQRNMAEAATNPAGVQAKCSAECNK